jgi:O-antigen/teichoic acid export membrane protein
VGFVVAILWAIGSPTAWALVVGRVATEVSFTVGTHLITEQPASLRWEPAAARDIMAFGAGMFASSATYFLAGEAERLVVGKFVSIAVLGCFSLALSITAVATGGLQQLLAQVFYPMIASSVRADRDLAASHFRKVRLILLIISGCMAVAFIGGGNWIVTVLLGSKYLMAGWMLQLLGFRAALELFTAGTTHILFALGTSKYAAAGNIAKLVFLGIGLTVAFGKFGFQEALWVLAISPAVAHIPLLIGIKKHLRAVLWTEVWTVAAFLASAGLTALLLRVAS